MGVRWLGYSGCLLAACTYNYINCSTSCQQCFFSLSPFFYMTFLCCHCYANWIGESFTFCLEDMTFSKVEHHLRNTNNVVFNTKLALEPSCIVMVGTRLISENKLAFWTVGSLGQDMGNRLRLKLRYPAICYVKDTLVCQLVNLCFKRYCCHVRIWS